MRGQSISSCRVRVSKDQRSILCCTYAKERKRPTVRRREEGREGGRECCMRRMRRRERTPGRDGEAAAEDDRGERELG